MKNTIILASGLLLASSAFASTTTVSDNATFKTDTYSSKAEAYNAGFDLSDSVKAMDQSQLRFNLPVQSYTLVKNISVGQSEVTVEEFANSNGDIQYRAIVDVDYQFNAKESN
ncbi:DUF3316 domain-containing protein [Vibrio diazotrophicus]|uniref:Acyl-CoA synthetase n=1 Tax=Vibrio diazotrophicus TaxID=685 RepID=A0ABX4WDE5_VIBDI|nr:DUF3316 domain-containing protein [Vibrio diazotrophicus]PNI00794.1 acyl-CoA synthetase [Vibrio diazotrophicus]